YHALLLCVFFHDTATTEIYTLSLHDALPIYSRLKGRNRVASTDPIAQKLTGLRGAIAELTVSADLMRRGYEVFAPVGSLSASFRSEEHTSELQSRENLVCRLLLEKKKQNRGT